MYAVLGRFGASASFLPFPEAEGRLVWGTTDGESADAVSDAKGGGEVGASCFNVISYLAFSIAYLESTPTCRFPEALSKGDCHAPNHNVLAQYGANNRLGDWHIS